MRKKKKTTWKNVLTLKSTVTTHEQEMFWKAHWVELNFYISCGLKKKKKKSKTYKDKIQKEYTFLQEKKNPKIVRFNTDT